MDFILKRYKILLNTLSDQGFSFQNFNGFVKGPLSKIVILRHDVDTIPLNSLEFARIQSELGIKGTYYFRAISGSFDEKTIQEVASLGHEIGYHYEDLSFAWAKLRAQGTGHRAQGRELEEIVVKIGIELFNQNLERLRKITSVKTICMHGSPMSRWDNRLLWKYYNYHDFGIIGEPYIDVNVEDMLYLTDTGRRWNGGSVAIRDKAQGAELRAQDQNQYRYWKVKPMPGSLMNMTQKGMDFQNKYKFRSTSDIIRAAEEGNLPDKIMMTFHPQRWTNRPIPWVKELVWQNVKNVGKYFVVKVRSE